MLPNLSLVMEFLGNFFINYVFEKFSGMNTGDGKSYSYQ